MMHKERKKERKYNPALFRACLDPWCFYKKLVFKKKLDRGV
jgi:hypothetical protein